MTKAMKYNRWTNSNWITPGSGRLSLEINLGGTFLFDYEGKIIKFGDSVDKSDADLILEKLKEPKVFSQRNYTS